MSVITKTTIKTLLGLNDTTLDDVIDLLIPQAEALVKSYLQREIEETTFTEYYSGTGKQILVLNQTPVQSILSVHEDADGYFENGTDAFPTSSVLAEGKDFVLRKDNASDNEVCKSGILYRIGKAWPRPFTHRHGQLALGPGLGLGNIKVVYVAGWTTIPADIQFAISKLVTSMLETRNKSGRLESESIEDYSYSLSGVGESDKMLDSVKSSLSHYKKVVI